MGTRSMGVARRWLLVLIGVAALALLGPSRISPPAPSRATAGTVPSGFQESITFSGLTNPTVVRFVSDGRVFVAEKSGLIKVFDSLADTTPTVFADLRTNVFNYWDRGLLGMALDPNFPATPYVYVLYSYDHILGDPSPPPRWGVIGATSDDCPTPPGPTTDGCVTSGRLSRLQAAGDVMTGSEQVLVENWCEQYPSHSIGTVEFGADGALYASGGDGASFDFVDYGQDGSPLNPCGDPPGGAGATLTPPTAEGGALRSQDLRTTGDQVTLDGSIIRVDPATGAALPTNPLAGNSDANARRIIAYGLRNPFRFTFRPGTSELWVGDVGWSDWEEINRILSPTDSTVENFGWPCYEGNSRQAGYDSANLNICENLYPTPNAVTNPFFAYHHNNKVVSGESCPTGSSSISGLSFEFSPAGSSYPAAYQRALFFADYSRNCIWVMKNDANGIPAPGLIETFDAGASGPVNLEFGPGGDLYYADFNGGTIRRVTYVGSGGGAGPDLALGRAASASSQETTVLSPDKAVDGNGSTRWSSNWLDGQWWQVDLGSAQQVSSVSINWEAAFASSYKVQVSTDGVSFADVASVSIAAAGVKSTSFAAVSTRYVRVLGVTRATQWGISFWDAQVFGPGAGVPVNTVLPVVSGSAVQGQTLSSSSGSWSNSPTSFAYQWRRCDAAGSSCVDVAGASSSSYLLVAGDAGSTLRSQVTASNGSGPSAPAVSLQTAVVSSGGGSGTDLALGRVASASSQETTVLSPDKAVDGNGSTRWSSGFLDGQWWQVDLGSVQQVSSVSINWEAAFASSYKVQVSTDGVSFTDAAAVSIATAGVKSTSFAAVSTRYVRVLGVTRATQWGISFWDAQVFGPVGGGNGSPTPVIDTPASTLTWKVGDPISFTGHASDPEQGTLPASALSWTLLIQHCPSNCHTHTIQSWPSVAGGSFNAPDHEYPSYLELQLTATDAGGASGTTTLRLDPKTVVLTFQSAPSGLGLAVNGTSSTTPFTRTVIVGSTNSISATTPQTVNGTTYEFASWSDGGAQTHSIVAPAAPVTHSAAYVIAPPPRNTVLPDISGQAREGRKLTVSNGTWTGSQPMSFAYKWSRCNSDGQACLDIADATASSYVATAADVGFRLRAVVTATNAGGAASATSSPTRAIRAA